jgi:hypothetical protein
LLVLRHQLEVLGRHVKHRSYARVTARCSRPQPSCCRPHAATGSSSRRTRCCAGPRARAAQVHLSPSEPGAPVDRRQNARARGPPGAREPALGLSADRRRARQARSVGLAEHGSPAANARRSGPGAEALGTFLARVPARALDPPRAPGKHDHQPGRQWVTRQAPQPEPLRGARGRHVTATRGSSPALTRSSAPKASTWSKRRSARRRPTRRPNVSCGPHEPNTWTEPALSAGWVTDPESHGGGVTLRAGVDRSSRSGSAGHGRPGQAVARIARTICGSSRQGRSRRSPSTKKVGVAWTPALRPPSMSARTRS